jgi:tRNA G18 (ribose-2'-O)-methylase SpoU
MDVDDFRISPKVPLILALDNVRSMNNIGSFFRTADAFRIERILLGGITARPPHRDIRKTALGAEDSVEWEHHTNLECALLQWKAKGYRLLAVEQAENAQMLNQMAEISDLPAVLIFGNEIDGVQQSIINICDACIEIPQYGTKHSLNVAVSAGIVCWAFAQPYINKQAW